MQDGAEMSIAADDQPLPRRGHFQKKAPAPLPRWYSKKCFDFQACDWFELELLLLIDLIC
jgi:hypothetical protein